MVKAPTNEPPRAAAKQRRHKAVAKAKSKRPGATDEAMRQALRSVFVSIPAQGEKPWGVKEAVRKMGRVTRGVLQRACWAVAAAAAKLGHSGYEKSTTGKRTKYPEPEELTRLYKDLDKIISNFRTAANAGRWQTYFTADEERHMVMIVEQRDFYGFGLDRPQL